MLISEKILPGDLVNFNLLAPNIFTARPDIEAVARLQQWRQINYLTTQLIVPQTNDSVALTLICSFAFFGSQLRFLIILILLALLLVPFVNLVLLSNEVVQAGSRRCRYILVVMLVCRPRDPVMHDGAVTNTVVVDW